jgi:hypothetical protein
VESRSCGKRIGPQRLLELLWISTGNFSIVRRSILGVAAYAAFSTNRPIADQSVLQTLFYGGGR